MTTTTSASDVAPLLIASPTAFEGASSFTSQAVQASQAAGVPLRTIQGSAEVVDALSSLHNLGKTPGSAGIRQDMRLGSSSTPRPVPDLQLLPAPFVLRLLAFFKDRHAALFIGYTFRDHGQLEQLCQSVYFPTRPLSIAQLALVNGMLFYLIKQLMMDGDHGFCDDYDLRMLLDQAEKNFHLGIETYDIFAHPSHDSVKALSLAVSAFIALPLLTDANVDAKITRRGKAPAYLDFCIYRSTTSNQPWISPRKFVEA